MREIDGDPPVPAWGARPWHLVQDSVAAFEAHVVDVLRGAAEPQPSGRHNLETLAMTLAAYRSAARDEIVDLARFVAGGCRAMSRIEADYWIETAWPLAEAAEAMAGEQSSGTFLPLPGETPELKERSAARVVALEDLGAGPRPVAARRRPGRRSRTAQGRVTLSWPIGNMGPSLPNLIAAVAGNLFELKQFSGLRLLDLRLPEEFAAANPGPQFGIDGTRRLAGVEGRPLIGTIVKPSVGLDAGRHRRAGGRALRRRARLREGRRAAGRRPGLPVRGPRAGGDGEIERAADRTGRKLMFAFNVTGEIDEMRRRHDLVLALGGTCVMANLTGVGLSGFLALAPPRRPADPRPPQRLGRADAAARRSASTTSPGRRSGGSPGPTTCTSTACATSSASPTTA